MIEALQYLRPYLKRYRVKYILGVVFILAANGFRIANPRMVQEGIDYLKGDFQLSHLGLIAAGVVLLTVGDGIFTFLMRRSLIVASREIENDLRNDFFSKLLEQTATFFHRNPTGDIMSRATNDLNAVRALLGPGIAYSVNTLFAFFFVIPMMVGISPSLTLYALLPIPVVAVLVNRFGKIIYKRFNRIQEQLAVLSNRAQENISGVTTIRWMAAEQEEKSLFREANREYMERNIDYAKVQAAFHPSLQMTIGFSTVVIIWIGGAQVISGGISLGQFTAFLMYTGILSWPAIALGWVIGTFQQGAAALNRMRKILEAVPEIPANPEGYAPERIEGDIAFRNLNFSYLPGQPVLQDLNLNLPPRSTVGLIGPTGCGKSTFIRLLMHQHTLPTGALLIDGRDINDFQLQALRRRIGYVPQETFLFSDTIANNIAYGVPDATREKIEWAARMADIHEQIVEFPDGYDAMLGEKGINLSGGQKQRVSIARALLREPDILILDDAFSALDTNTEHRILENLREVLPGRTVILVSHRVSTLQEADLVLVMEDGRITDSGRHEALIAREGLYAWTHQRQLLEAELAES
ncbi:MAG TPA: ABC transporter ATP-binding protein [Calditrichia bacterium]|nr:ABC transporter ATP-binding protein [Calditrichota bacterium]HQU70921.1 ABC transporter ATP-binding protein [Calditrichia bacterium]HQV30239.1 ABC transporter ATP-binding protein [Calditrichia bacterium]